MTGRNLPTRISLWRSGFRRSSSSADRAPAFPPKKGASCAHADAHHRAVIAAARTLPHGTPVSDELIVALQAEIAARRDGAGMTGGPGAPFVSGLQVRHDGLPDWWEASGSLMLAAPDSGPIEVKVGLGMLPASNALVVIGAGGMPPRFDIVGSNGLAVVGDRVVMLASSFTIGDEATILVGEKTSGTWMTLADARNAGMLIIGADCMFAAGVVMRTDDTHAIRDAETNARVNIRGGRILVEEHVWLGEGVRVMGDTRIGSGGVVGATSLVKGILPSNTVSAGQPARPRRSGIVWTREDAA